MEKSCHSSSSNGGGGDSSLTTAASNGGSVVTTTSSNINTNTNSSSNNNNNNNNKDVYLKHLNKTSYKISKPVRRPPVFDQNNSQNLEIPAPPPPVQQQNQASAAQQSQQQQQQHQPPVYNINKNDFRDVVQRLTGSPAHERFSTPPPIQPPKPPSSRLQRIRPPPLAQISNRPPTFPQLSNPGPAAVGFFGGQRQPLSPLPPFPTVHAAAESPISAYMRFLQSSVSSAASPRWNSFPPPPPQPQMLPMPSALHQHQQLQNIPPPPQGFPQLPILPPTSPVPFGCIPSPRSPYALLSPSLLFSPTGQLGFPSLPLSPSLPVPSPRWKGI